MIAEQLTACHSITSIVTSKHDDRPEQIITECRPLLQQIVPAQTRFRQLSRDISPTDTASNEQRQTSGLLARRANSLGVGGPTQKALKLGLLLPEEIACAAKHQSAPLPGHLVDGLLSPWQICEPGVTFSQHPAFPDLPPSEALRLGLLLPADNSSSLPLSSRVKEGDSKGPDNVFFEDYQRFPTVRSISQDVLGGLFKRSTPRTSSFTGISPLSSPLSPSFPSPWSTKRHKLTKSDDLVGELVDEAVKQDIVNRVRTTGATYRLRLERGNFDIEATNTKISNPDGVDETVPTTIPSKDSSLVDDVANSKVAPLDYARAYYLESSRARKEGRRGQLTKPLLKHCHTKGHKDFFVLSKVPAAAARDVSIPRLPSVQLHTRVDDSASHNCVDIDTTTSHDPVQPEDEHNELIGRGESPDSAVTMFRVLKKTRGARRDSGSSDSVTSSNCLDMDSDFVKSPMLPPVLPELQFGDHTVDGGETLGLARMRSIARRYDSDDWRRMSGIQDSYGADVKADSEVEGESGPMDEEMKQTNSSVANVEASGECGDVSIDPSVSHPSGITAVSTNASASQTRTRKHALSAEAMKASPGNYTAFPPLRDPHATDIRLVSRKLSSEAPVDAPALLFISKEYASKGTPTPCPVEAEADTLPLISHASQHDHSHKSTPDYASLESVPVASAASTKPGAGLFFGPVFSASSRRPSNESCALHSATSVPDVLAVSPPPKSALRTKTVKYSLTPSLEKRTSACIPPLFSPLKTSPMSPKISEAAVSMNTSKNTASTPTGSTCNLTAKAPMSSPALAIALSEPELALPVLQDGADNSIITTPMSPIEVANKAMHELIDEMIDHSIGDACGDSGDEGESSENVQGLGVRREEIHLPSVNAATRQPHSVQRGRKMSRSDGTQTNEACSDLGPASKRSPQMQHRLLPSSPLYIARPSTTPKTLANSEILTASDTQSPRLLTPSSPGARPHSLGLSHREPSQDGDRSCISGTTTSSSQSKGSLTTSSSESVNNCYPSPRGHYPYGDGSQRPRLWKEIPVFDKYQGTLAEQDARAKAAKEEATRLIRERREKKLAAKAERKELKRLKKAEEEESKRLFRVASGEEIRTPEEEISPSTQDEISPLRYPMTATLPATGYGRNGGSAADVAAASPSPRRQQSLPVLRHRASARILSSVFRSNAGSGV
ncbi:hypothetical protein MN608_08882 [Microdochium nivale]|nr:hypothetical protein MN608_08882 [Microdochium nivale]